MTQRVKQLPEDCCMIHIYTDSPYYRYSARQVIVIYICVNSALLIISARVYNVVAGRPQDG